MKSKTTAEQLEATVVACASKAENAANPLEALQYTQAALNAAHALNTIIDANKIR